MTAWELPSSVEIGGREYRVNTDYRDILEIIRVLQDLDRHEKVRCFVALSLFYEGFDEMPSCCYEEAVFSMFNFISLGEEDDGNPQPKLIDWDQDGTTIVAEINKVAGLEIRALEHLHWWTFVAYFNGIGEGPLSYIVSIRDKLRRKKPLEKHEKDFYKKNRSRVDFKQKLTTSEEAVLDKWLNPELR